MTHSNIRKCFIYSLIFFTIFLLWTIAILFVDVKPIGPEDTMAGFSALNAAFHKLTGEHFAIYKITEILGIIPFIICMAFAAIGLLQWIARKNILKVDADIIALGFFYIFVIALYFSFDILKINLRPVIIDGELEASYPSSHTLLVLTVVPTAVLQIKNRIRKRKLVNTLSISFSIFAVVLVVLRTVCGVHWITDIIGGIILSISLDFLYTGVYYSLRNVKKRKQIYRY